MDPMNAANPENAAEVEYFSNRVDEIFTKVDKVSFFFFFSTKIGTFYCEPCLKGFKFVIISVCYYILISFSFSFGFLSLNVQEINWAATLCLIENKVE